MILEGFEIENWSCIKRVYVDGLLPTGVNVLHGPNGTGKTSIIEALRACLMDNKSNSTAIGRAVPKNSSEKPRVIVSFRAAGNSWRITKLFKSKESKLESKTSSGQWKLETSDPSEAHERTRKLCGGSDSSLGLHQLLWLTQAEFRLPEPKRFDTDVQSRLRAVLGVFQTPLDDQFLTRVKEEWSRWFGARSKPGERPKLKTDCPLDKDLAFLEKQKQELDTIESQYQEFERMMRRLGSLEVQLRDLRRQQDEKIRSRDLLQQEYEKSLKRLDAHKLATERFKNAEKVLVEEQALQTRRADTEQHRRDAERSAETASRKVVETSQRLQFAEQSMRELRLEIQGLETVRRESQDRLNEVTERRELLTLKQQKATALDTLKRAEQTAGELEDINKLLRDHPAPDDDTVKKLEENRSKATQLRAELEAAALMLTLVPDPGAAVPHLVIDGIPTEQVLRETDRTYIRQAVRRRAEIAIPGWGRVGLLRGSDARSLDEIEDELKELERRFAEKLAPFGVAIGDPKALDQLRNLAAEKKLRDPEMKRKQNEMTKIAPNGLEPLHTEVARLEKLHHARESEVISQSSRIQLPLDEVLLEQMTRQLKKDIGELETNIATRGNEVKKLEREIEGNPDTETPVSKRSDKLEKKRNDIIGLRQQDAAAREQFTMLNATAEVHRTNLERMPTTDQIERAVKHAETTVNNARNELESAKLSEREETIHERLETVNEALRMLHLQLTTDEREYHQIEGALRLTEGLHQKRSAAAIRVEELTRQTQQEMLQSEAFDRLYALFEECRDRKIETVMGPIQDRILRWMRLLRIGGYQSMRFNDQFLPEKLIASGGAIELSLGEESTGSIEQIGLMVRLALGSALSTPEEPAVALLDDPLTHSDVIRLDLMRAVLKNATQGDSAAKPPAGPLQIIVFTCHPEWFAIDGAKIIDLSKPDVLSRSI
jgi:chromosome segregation ATPase